MWVPVPNDNIVDLLQLVRAEYLEIPGLHLTLGQAQRLWGLDRTTCEALLNTLVGAGFLRRTRDAGYVRADAG
jgi:DNA-binding IclR family transcriptional regulator